MLCTMMDAASYQTSRDVVFNDEMVAWIAAGRVVTMSQ